jgi:predicted RNase H-like HicB family nuclease
MKPVFLLAHVLYLATHIKYNNTEMKTIIQIHKEDKYFVAVDLITNVADQGLTEEEAVANLKKGLEEHYQIHYQILMELASKGGKISFSDLLC